MKIKCKILPRNAFQDLLFISVIVAHIKFLKFSLVRLWYLNKTFFYWDKDFATSTLASGGTLLEHCIISRFHAFWDLIKSLVEHSSGIDTSNLSLAVKEKIVFFTHFRWKLVFLNKKSTLKTRFHKKIWKNPRFFVVATEGGKFFQFWLILTGKKPKNVKKVFFYAKKVKKVIFAKKVKKYVNIFFTFFF